MTPSKRHVKGTDRFWSKVDVKGSDGCWEWTGYRTEKGYGIIGVDRKKVRTHRYSYEISIGPVGDLHVCHRCDNPACVNPSHLFLGTNEDNHNDKMAKGSAKGPSKLTDEDCQFIRDNWVPNQHGSTASLVVKFGATRRTITKIGRSNV